eukprot:SAG31_NODE_3655_length_4020_cov_15.839582_4_plen_87_part_00
MGCQLQPDDNVTVGVASYHSVGGQTMTYQCFIMNSTGCEDSGTYDGQLLRGDWRYCNPVSVEPLFSSRFNGLIRAQPLTVVVGRRW